MTYRRDMRTIAIDLSRTRYIVAASTNPSAQAFVWDDAARERGPNVLVGSIVAHAEADEWTPIDDVAAVTARAVAAPTPSLPPPAAR